MQINLMPRTAEHVKIYYEKTRQPVIRQRLPQKAQTLEAALMDFAQTQLPGATSYGCTIYADDRYVGDVWIYAINQEDTPNAMLSYCIFDLDMWGKGVATQAVCLFLKDVEAKYDLKSIGAFAYAANTASIRVLEKNGFSMEDEFVEDGVVSRYYQR